MKEEDGVGYGLFFIGMLVGGALVIAMMWPLDSVNVAASDVCGFALNGDAPAWTWYVAEDVAVEEEVITIRCKMENVTSMGVVW